MSEEPELTGESRNADGTFKSGISGNPNGRPIGSMSITAMIRKKLEEIPMGQMRSYAEQVVETILHNAIVVKDQRALKDIWNYMDGLPKGTIGLDADKESLEALTGYFKAMADAKKS